MTASLLVGQQAVAQPRTKSQTKKAELRAQKQKVKTARRLARAEKHLKPGRLEAKLKSLNRLGKLKKVKRVRKHLERRRARKLQKKVARSSKKLRRETKRGYDLAPFASFGYLISGIGIAYLAAEIMGAMSGSSVTSGGDLPGSALLLGFGSSINSIAAHSKRDARGDAIKKHLGDVPKPMQDFLGKHALIGDLAP